MITVDQLNPKHYPREYWVNVYEIEGKQEIGGKYSRDNAIQKAEYVWNTFDTPCLYRIRVRLK